MSLQDHIDRYPHNRFINRQTICGQTGTMAAALASGAAILAARYPAAGLGVTLVHRIHVHYVCLVAFAVPLTAGRGLVLVRGAGADPSGGGDLTNVDADAIAAVDGSALLAGKVATTAALTVAGITLETSPRARMLLAGAGNAGNDYDEVWDLSDNPLVLAPGKLFAVCAGQLFDATGTWQASITADAVEVG